MASLRPATQALLDRVEILSGAPVRLMRDDSLAVLATMITARGGAPYHVLRYKPTNQPLDYIVSYQAGFLLRLYQTTLDRRFDFAPGDRGLQAIRAMLLTMPGLTSADRELASQFAQQLHHWALMTLRSLPVGMRIDEEVWRTRPELHEAQIESLTLQQQQNAALLSQRVGNLATPTVLLGPYAAYALYADELLGDSSFAVPFRASGLGADGRALLELWRAVPADPTHDCELIDRWAATLGMADWYRWVPFRA